MVLVSVLAVALHVVPFVLFRRWMDRVAGEYAVDGARQASA